VTTPAHLLEEARDVAAAPVVDMAVAAGPGRELWDEVVSEWIAVPRDLPSDRYIALRIAGDSMAPLLHTGDTVLIRVGGRAQVDRVVVARHPDGGYVCKVVRRIRATTVELGSLNPAHPSVVIPRDERLIVGPVVLAWCSPRARAAGRAAGRAAPPR
jgi:phage repressor protein C with HTH and peptisase S24 domain